MNHGLQFDAGYTFSKSLDYGSDTERTGELNGALGRNSNSEILNASTLVSTAVFQTSISGA